MKVLNLLWRTIKIHIAKFGLWLFKKNSKYLFNAFEVNIMEKREAIKAMKSVAGFISDALELTKRVNPNSYDQQIYQELAENCAVVLEYLKQE